MGIAAFFAAMFVSSVIVNYFQFRTISQMETELEKIKFSKLLQQRICKPTKLPCPMPQNGRWN